jgi:hypothetical protein
MDSTLGEFLNQFCPCGAHPITWTPEPHRSFEVCKTSLSRTALLAYPDPSALLTLVTDASMSAFGAVLQQRVQNA